MAGQIAGLRVSYSNRNRGGVTAARAVQPQPKPRHTAIARNLQLRSRRCILRVDAKSKATTRCGPGPVCPLVPVGDVKAVQRQAFQRRQHWPVTQRVDLAHQPDKAVRQQSAIARLRQHKCQPHLALRIAGQVNRRARQGHALHQGCAVEQKPARADCGIHRVDLRQRRARRIGHLRLIQSHTRMQVRPHAQRDIAKVDAAAAKHGAGPLCHQIRHPRRRSNVTVEHHHQRDHGKDDRQY